MQDKQQAEALSTQLFNAIKVSLDPGQIEAFGKGLEKLTPKISDTQAEELSDQLIILIKDSQDTYTSFKTLRQSLASIAARKQDEQQAGALANQLLTTMKESMAPEQFDALGQGLAAIATKIPVSELEQLTIQLINAINDPSQFKIIGQGLQENDLDRFRTIGQSLAAMIKMMPEKQAKTLAKTLFLDIINSDIKKPLDPGQFQALGQGLAEVTAKMTQTQTNAFAKQLFYRNDGCKVLLQAS